MRRLGILLTAAALLAGCMDAPAAHSTFREPAYLVWAAPYPDLLVEIDHVEGWAPLPGAVENLMDVLHSVTDKRNITLLPYGSIPRSTIQSNLPHEWTTEELLALAAKHRDAAPAGPPVNGTAGVLHILYLDGRYPGAGGLAIGLTAFLFEPNGWTTEWKERGPPGEAFQRALLLHEVGHVLGLVNAGIPMVRPHNLPDDPVHSRNPESVMAPSVESERALLALIDENQAPPYKFDADDLADLAAFREEGRRWAAANGYS